MKNIEWGFLIVNYLFLGGLSAGLFFVSALATLMQRNGATPQYTRIARYGALLAPWPVMVGCLLLVFDLGKWYRFYKLFLHLRWTSPMSIGSWLLLAFNGVSLLFLFAWLSEQERGRLFGLLPKRLLFLNRFNRDISFWLRPIAMAALPLSVAVGIYTGVLLGAVQSRPFWNTNLVAQLFLASALSTGCALLIFVLVTTCREVDFAGIRLLCALDIFFLVLEVFIVVPYIVHGSLSTQAVQDSLQLILGGPFTLLFWVFFLALGVLLPLGIEIREILPSLLARTSGHCSRPLAAVTAALVLAGGFVLRLIFVYAGQMSAFQ
jgi:formate-dependent nitrite reductase membrane component NrfD